MAGNLLNDLLLTKTEDCFDKDESYVSSFSWNVDSARLAKAKADKFKSSSSNSSDEYVSRSSSTTLISASTGSSSISTWNEIGLKHMDFGRVSHARRTESLNSSLAKPIVIALMIAWGFMVLAILIFVLVTKRSSQQEL